MIATSATVRWYVFIFIAALCSGCRGLDARLDDANESLVSLRATTIFLVHAWLSGDVTDRFARVALARTYTLSERTRTSLALSLRPMADSRVAAVTQDCEHLSRLLARLDDSIGRHDRTAAEEALVEVSSPTVSLREEDR